MSRTFLSWLKPEDWKRSIALVILWAYAYQLVVWPIWFNLTLILSAVFGVSIPAPVIVPWEQLLAGTTTLATVGGIQAWKDKDAGTTVERQVSVTESSSTKATV